MGLEFDLKILPTAQFDLERIALLHLSYVGPGSARKITDELYDALEHLRRFPDMGIMLPDKELRSLGYRGLIVGHYLCVYRHIETMIFVYQITDMRSDYPKLLKMLPQGQV